ncbi:ribosomal protein s6 kinase beta-2 [Stylonychia lemnae]|uniref:Ribosomal protein s6 kinase beta-2 n=1 Tax=Stylonychia lemnae TaxID=5949 RepID=A0A078A649_STYLE|nr:ribosomal protein s6 kinase beta-2 [Stylonychia lemnae]|eukprot:CDW76229.1 ribosomal protein s6 kinase beta-2 [Stylonychia lemnae]
MGGCAACFGTQNNEFQDDKFDPKQANLISNHYNPEPSPSKSSHSFDRLNTNNQYRKESIRVDWWEDPNEKSQTNQKSKLQIINESLVSFEQSRSKEIQYLFHNAGLEDFEPIKVTLTKFNLYKVLGTGSFGKVFLVKMKNSQNISSLKYAMKVINKDKLKLQNDNHEYMNRQVQSKFILYFNYALGEKELLQSFENPFIVRIYKTFEDDENHYFIMDYLSGGSLDQILKNEKQLLNNQVKFYVAQIVIAFHYLHSMGIIYRDLKPENIVLDDQGYLKITDFGIAKRGVQGLKKSYTFCGTTEYLAPEFLRQKGHNKSVDWWCLGILIYELLSGESPFMSERKNRQKLFNAILNSPIKKQSQFSEQSWELIQSLLLRDPTLRLGGSKRDALDIIQHPFFDGFEWEKLIAREVRPEYIPDNRQSPQNVETLVDDLDSMLLNQNDNSSKLHVSYEAPLKVSLSSKQDIFKDFST